jgi:hypothetical protein
MTGLRLSALETLRCSNPVGRGTPALATSPNGRPHTRRLPCASVTRPQVVPRPCGCTAGGAYPRTAMHRSRGRTADREMRLRRLREHANFAELSQAAGNYAPDLEAASQAAAQGYPICLYLDAGAFDLSTHTQRYLPLRGEAKPGARTRCVKLREARAYSAWATNAQRPNRRVGACVTVCVPERARMHLRASV